nr:phosphopantetheine-binding protein [Paenibacillus arenosi]
MGPSTETEKIIAEVWKEVLKVEEVGIHDNFFDLNGTSLDVIRVTSKLSKALQTPFEVVTMFTYPTIALFSKHLMQEQAAEKSDQDREAVLQAGNSRMMSNVSRFKQQSGRTR